MPLGQLSDSNIPIPNFLAMVLDTNMAFRLASQSAACP